MLCNGSVSPVLWSCGKCCFFSGEVLHGLMQFRVWIPSCAVCAAHVLCLHCIIMQVACEIQVTSDASCIACKLSRHVCCIKQYYDFSQDTGVTPWPAFLWKPHQEGGCFTCFTNTCSAWGFSTRIILITSVRHCMLSSDVHLCILSVVQLR
jgi:hypothetical protein